MAAGGRSQKNYFQLYFTAIGSLSYCFAVSLPARVVSEVRLDYLKWQSVENKHRKNEIGRAELRHTQTDSKVHGRTRQIYRQTDYGWISSWRGCSSSSVILSETQSLILKKIVSLEKEDLGKVRRKSWFLRSFVGGLVPFRLRLPASWSDCQPFDWGCIGAAESRRPAPLVAAEPRTLTSTASAFASSSLLRWRTRVASTAVRGAPPTSTWRPDPSCAPNAPECCES